MNQGKDTYNPSQLEQKWRENWYSTNLYKAQDFSPKPKKYILAELPYPSGKSLHIGHAMRYTVPDVYARFLRMQGYNVLFPMGWDSFGLPTEGYALKEEKPPQEVTERLKKDYRGAMESMGYGIDWDREFATSDPETYKWTQWLFLKFYEHGLAKLREMPVWWCQELGNLADEEVLTDAEGNKVSERGGYKVEKKMFKQWVLKIPQYAEKLLEGLNEIDFPEHIKIAQANWIGKSVGYNVKFDVYTKKTISSSETSSESSSENNFIDTIEIYTTRPDTIYGVTFLVLAPEHPLAEKLIKLAKNKDEAQKYFEYAKNLSDMDKKTLEKTGVKLEGFFAKHPFNEVVREIPIFIGNYILMEAGTGAVMGVPAHDQRDLEFAQKYNLPEILVIKDEKMLNSGEFDGLSVKEGFEKIVQGLEKLGKAYKTVNYKIRDWVFSRQRYWGEPIPMVYKESGEVEAVVKTSDTKGVHQKLPVTLPYSTEYTPTKDGEPPLARIKEWVQTTDSEGRPAKRETQTMPTWAGSSWYYLRYLDPHNSEEFANWEKMKYWLPVDKYFGGAEHTTVHLLYSRFWHKFFYDIGLVPTKEPYQWRMTGGLLLASDGRKMSKRFGNVVEPQVLIENYGADATRIALCFLGPYTDTFPWNENIIKSSWRLLNTIYSLKDKVIKTTSPTNGKSKSSNNSSGSNNGHDSNVNDLEKLLHKTIKNVTKMLEDLKVNTAVSQIMILTSELKKQNEINPEIWESFLKILAPLAPFIAEELWQEYHGWKEWDPQNSIHLSEWPKFDESLTQNKNVCLGVQINGKIRSEIEILADTSEEDIKKIIFAKEDLKKYLEGKTLQKFIYIPGKIVSLVVS